MLLSEVDLIASQELVGNLEERDPSISHSSPFVPLVWGLGIVPVALQLIAYKIS